jgi:hypothetical protein
MNSESAVRDNWTQYPRSTVKEELALLEYPNREPWIINPMISR